MNIKISYIIYLSIFSPLVNAAEDIKTIENGTKYEGSATYPKLELYPGQLKDFAQLTEDMRLLEIKRLLNILNRLRNNEIVEATQILEAELQETVKALKSIKGSE